MSFADLLDKYDPRIRRAFLEAMDRIASDAQIGQIADALERGDLEGAIDAIFIDRGAYEAFEREIEAAYGEGGMQTIEDLGRLRTPTGDRFIVRFDRRDLRAERWLSEYSSTKVTRIMEDQRTAIRAHLQNGMEQGDNPRRTALDIAGRINRRTGRREGGVIGLSIPQEQAVRRAREELENGDYGAYRTRTLRDKRFDRTIARAEQDGRSLTNVEIIKITNRYSDRLLKLRGETIGRTESLTALHAGQDQALRQLVDSGNVTANQIRRIWDATGDSRTRLTHMAADGQSVGLDEAFDVGGARMMFPGDPNGPPEEVINCRCLLRVRIDFVGNL